jgi:ABC-type lipoprotein export system ATPase subunit/ABC-type antimicrobial peptide transport system permease subunit
VIRTENLCRHFQLGEKVTALDGVSVSIDAGEYVAITGPSGSGKSTFMGLVGCLDRPTSGKCWIDGVETSDLGSDDLAAIRNRKIGFIFQNFNLLDRLNARENIELPLMYAGVQREVRRKISDTTLSMVGLTDRSNHLPSQLSGGQQQRVAVARALACSPSIILADEPTGALDSRTANEMMTLFRKLSDFGKTIVVVTHDPQVAQRLPGHPFFRWQGSMNASETVRAAVMALRDHKLRSALTALGIIIGTSATIALLAIGAGARAQVAAQVRSLGSNLLVVVSGNVSQSGVRLGAGATPTLTDEDAAAISQEIPSVQVTSSLISGKIQIVAEAANWATTLVTVDPGYLEVRDWGVESGRWFEADEAKTGAQAALLGQTVAKQLFPDVDPIGHEIRMKNVPFRVIGMLAKKGQSTTGQDQDDALIVPLNAGRRVLGNNQAKLHSVGAILVKVRDGESMAQTTEDAESLLRQRHRLLPLRDSDFSIRNLSVITEAREAGARTLSILLASVALVSLVTGGIGILNIMLVSVIERTKEIGIRMAVGAKRRDILLQFLFEAVALSVLGGVVGVILGLVAAFVFAHMADWSLIVDTWAVASSVVFSMVVGILFGWYPALRASRLEPIEAIRTV